MARRLTIFLIFTVLIVFQSKATTYACPLNCNDLIHISLASNCARTISARDVMNGDTSCMDDLIVDIQYKGKSIGNQVGVNHIGKTLKYRVIDPNGNNNSCWGELLISKKSKPIVDLDTLEIDCLDPIPSVTGLKDSCGLTLSAQILSSSYTELNCSGTDTLIGRINRRILILDLWGNSTEVNQVINLNRSDLDNITCPANKWFECCTPVNGKSIWDSKYSVIDNQGYAHPKPILDDHGNSVGLVDPPYRLVDGKKMYLWDFKGKCKIAIGYSDHIIKHCGWSYTIKRHWTIADWCSGEEWSCYQEIEISDDKGPEVAPLADIAINTADYDCKAKYIIKRPTIVKECGLEGAGYESAAFHHKIEVHFKILKKSNGYYSEYNSIKDGYLDHHEEVPIHLNPGTYHVKYELWDDCENYTKVEHEVTVRDNSGPIAQCVGSKSVTMHDGCHQRVYAKDLDNGSYHTCCSKVHVAIAHMDSVNYYKQYWQDHYKDCLSYSEYQRSKYEIDQMIEEWINSFLFNDYVDLHGCGYEKIIFRTYEACDMKPYESWFPGNKHQWYNYQTTQHYDCYFISHYPYLDQDVYHHAPMKCTSNPSVNYCYQYSGNTYSWLSSQGISSQMVNTLKKVERDAPTSYAKGKYVDCTINMHKQSYGSPSCEAPQDLTLYCDGTPTEGSINIEGQIIPFENPTFAHAIECNNPAGFWSGPEASAYGLYSNTALSAEGCDSVLYGIENLGLNLVWKPIYCRSWLLLDDTEKDIDFKSFFGELTFEDPCNSYVVSSNLQEDVNDCGSGILSKTWTIEDDCGKKSTCSQSITILHRSDFEVIFPEDLTISEETYSPTSNFGHPVVDDTDCEKIEISFKDVVDSSSGSVTSVLRYWTVTNECVETESIGRDIIIDDQVIASDERSCVIRHLKDNGDGLMQYVQVIEFSHKPVITMACPDDLSFCTDSTCIASIVIDSLVSFESETGFSITSIGFTVMLENSDSVVSGSGNSINLTLPIGRHQVKVLTILNDGTELNCQFLITVESCQPFQVQCVEDLVFCNNGECASDTIDALLGTAFDLCNPLSTFNYQYLVRPFNSLDPQEWILGEGNVLSGVFPVGSHSVLLIVSDQDGQIDSCEVPLIINDCSDLRIEYLGDDFFCNAPGECITDTVEMEWTVNKTCAQDSNYNLSYLFIIKPFGTDEHEQWILESDKSFRGTLPVGTHIVEMMVIDPSGPSDTMIMQIEVQDCEAPTIICLDSLPVFDFADSTGLILEATDLIDRFEDNCPLDEIEFSFSGDTSILNLQISCADLVAGQDTFTTNVYLIDQAGNTDTCSVTFIVKDNGVCSQQSSLAQQSMATGMMKKQIYISDRPIAEALKAQNTNLFGSVHTGFVTTVRPNPFKESITIDYEQSELSEVILGVFDVKGKQILSMINKAHQGVGEFRIRGNQLPQSGVYICRIQSNQSFSTHRISFIK